MVYKEIRELSKKTAKKLGYEINETLPLLDDNKKIRDLENIICRSLILNCIVACSFGFDKVKALEWIKNENLENFLTSREKDFLKSETSDNNPIFQTQVESLWVFAWVFGFIKEIDFSTPCSNQLVKIFPNLKENESSKSFREKVRLQSYDSIISYCDLSYCLHWSIRQAELDEEKIPGKIKSYVVIERRKVFEWIISIDSWDEVYLDT